MSNSEDKVPPAYAEQLRVAGEAIAEQQRTIDRLRAALTQIARYSEGPVVHSGFDNPADAQIARDALEGQQPVAETHCPVCEAEADEHGVIVHESCCTAGV